MIYHSKKSKILEKKNVQELRKINIKTNEIEINQTKKNEGFASRKTGRY